MDRIGAVNLNNNILCERSNVMIGETILIEIMFWSLAIWVCVRFNKDLHKDIFAMKKRQWKFVNEVDGKEYTIEEM